ncbi:hypothetical protein COU18_03665 [Candidatus Kaiserbacteria bacterium CG10_big_fil_rev_8_21_14_0_10_51_14]|uniref:Transposase IS200-like domain-containing protein n=1 Tax=Candidatus Kaiserbacteria bacterium CG10_big_fil_rev_8_21_14_0_10_51_14 TaxID=1974610 RepID=A0A2H0UBE3_9BACT|nr:MAG: hypothetical protein COU18_03665 [Candidatus Kaiserbacteria bacterium CG10_big_fil_rev_8_21_14_0_10_51_14]
MELYHVLNRGVDKRTLFLDDKDRARFVHDMWEFNDIEDAKNVWYRAPQYSGLRNHYMEKERIIDLHAWCIMGNHYHLLISERVDGGLTKFIRRLNVGYANYFNERYKRKGTLFQGRSKKILINTDPHFLHILNYIHSNPLDFSRDGKRWREKKLPSATDALKNLEKYKWSSYLDYTGTHNFPSVLTTELFSDVFKDYKKEILSFLQSNEARTIKEYQLEY